MTFIIKDWAGNILSYEGRFTLPQFSVPMEFEMFEDGWEWILENVEYEESHQDLYVEEL